MSTNATSKTMESCVAVEEAESEYSNEKEQKLKIDIQISKSPVQSETGDEEVTPGGELPDVGKMVRKIKTLKKKISVIEHRSIFNN
ncbi:hypothetical protein DLAC_11435 [Tieghemostelium lacteum]|uniref:Uncharacterized protein n=1 Tax=Tieghemostelium lacteum TaxID=361077 RepID=A0A152A950_TIELA|nr:hypothetical protein DLAC_11435 [Tieghemostelium lacteum]|eukprot:KYR02744.1 hypothetical protein DLAC_11435 [Tieghemostelium lacteum]